MRTGCQHRIDQELYLCQFEVSDAHMIVSLSSDLFLDNLDAKLLHVLQIGIDAFRSAVTPYLSSSSKI